MANAAKALFAAALLLSASVGCGDADPVEPGTLEIGVRGPDGGFEALADGDRLELQLFYDGLVMSLPALSVDGAEPGPVDVDLRTTIDGVMVATSVDDELALERDGDRLVVWDIRLAYITPMCCYLCAGGRITAELVDAAGRPFAAALAVELALYGDTAEVCDTGTACCASERECPDGVATILCE